MSSLAALRTGAGLVTAAVPREIVTEVGRGCAGVDGKRDWRRRGGGGVGRILLRRRWKG